MDSDSDGEGVKEGLSNILIIEGESACGKTAAVHACAAQLGFTVIEMNASHLRSTAAVKKQCSEGVYGFTCLKIQHLVFSNYQGSGPSACTSILLLLSPLLFHL